MNMIWHESSVAGMDAQALADFEHQFSYPLGEECRFRICHGDDYLRFFRAMGQASLLVGGNGGVIQGSIVNVIRTFTFTADGHFPVGGKVHYLCDLKILPASRGAMVLGRLLHETKRSIEASDSTLCYSVVMDGTDRVPPDYTGRLDIPRFSKLAEIAILRIAGDDSDEPWGCREVSEDDFREISASIPQQGVRMERGDGVARSLMEPLYLVTAAGDACGVLEDTRSSKRLLLDSGEELVSNHLSGLRYETPRAAAVLLGDATRRSSRNHVPAIFVAVPAREAAALVPLLGESFQVTIAPASIYGHGFESGMDWWIDTAEI